MSFKEGYRLSGAYNGWGLANYTKVLSDPLFINAIKTTFTYVFTVVPIATVLSIVVAVLLNQKIKIQNYTLMLFKLQAKFLLMFKQTA